MWGTWGNCSKTAPRVDSLLAVVAVEEFSCLLEVLSGARKRKQGEISNAPCISRRIAHLI
jgi:hypothetical protein